MVESASLTTRRFTANACLHRGFAPGRRFLRRNLRHILDTHEFLLHRKADDASYETMIANERRRAGWNFPTVGMLRDLVKGERPVLQIDALYFRHPRSNFLKRKRGARDGGDGSLDFLPAPGHEGNWVCDVRIAVRETRESKRSVHVEQRKATISFVRQTDKL